MNSEKWMDFLDQFDTDIEELFAEIANAKLNTERNRGLRRDIMRRFLAQLLTDDERARLLGLPQGCRIREGAKILSPENFECGEHVWIGENAMIDASGGLTVGSHTTIGCGVYVWTHQSLLANLLHENVPSSPLIVRKSTRIGSGCYIVGHSVINPGVTVSDDCVVLPMTVVTKDVPAKSIVAGSPHKVVGIADEDYIRHLKQSLASDYH